MKSAKLKNSPINFDEASRAWMMNKKRVGASYKYVCGHRTINGGACQNVVSANTKCYRHKKK